MYITKENLELKKGGDVSFLMFERSNEGSGKKYTAPHKLLKVIPVG